MADQFVSVLRSPDGVAVVRLDRPTANALSQAMLGQLEEVVAFNVAEAQGTRERAQN